MDHAVTDALISALPLPLRTSGERFRHLHLCAMLVVDIMAANLAFYLAYSLRYVWEVGGDVPGESFVSYPVYLPAQVVFTALYVIGIHLRRGYSLPRAASLAAESWSIVESTAFAGIVVFTITSMVRYPATSRLTFVYAWLLTVVLAVLGRLLIRFTRARLHEMGYGIERVIVVGNNRLARMIMQMLAQQGQLGYRVLGFVDDAIRVDFGRFRALGGVQQLPHLVEQLKADRVIVALPASEHNEIMWVLDHCQNGGIQFSLVPDLFELRLSHVNLDTVSGIPLFALKEAGIGGFNRVLKRGLDVVGSGLLLLTLAPIFGLIALAIKLDSPGPVLFRQPRLGKGGREFTCLKFRSMRDGADNEVQQLQELNEADGPIFKIREDPRLTRVGRFIRRLSIDEFPQFLNVWQGEMSLIGPRPPIPREVEQYEDWHRRRLEVVPGITGLWQVSGRSELSFDEMAMLDIYYIENWSLGLDLQILTRTLPAVFRASGAF